MILTHEMLESKKIDPMSRSEQTGKNRERLIKQRDEVFGAHRLSDEARFILSEHDIEAEEQRGRRLSPMFWQYWTKKSRKTSRL